MKNAFIFLAFAVMLFVFSGCAEPTPEGGPYGFLSGLVHGVLMPFAFIGSLFMDNVVIYGAPNVGFWYDLGYVIGASIIFGGSGGGIGRRRR